VINAVASHILALPDWLALLVVFALPALESSAFVGFVFPGEVALILGGVLASQGRLSLAAVLVAGIAGAIVGDSAGYLVGRRYGRGLLEGTLGRFVRHHHFDRAEAYLAERGGKSVFFGRFTVALRVMIPGLAGMSRMPYRKFAVYNIAGATAWGTFTVMMGYLGGASWQHVAHLASRIGLAALALVVLAFAAGWVLRRARRNGEGPTSLSWAWVRTGRGLAASPPGRWLTARYGRQVAWVGRRLDPLAPTGLSLTVLLTVAAACAWTFAGLTQDVTSHEGLALADPRVHTWVLAHRTDWLDTVMRTVTWAGSTMILLPVLVLSTVLQRRARGSWRPAVEVAVAYGAAVVAHAVVAGAVERPRPPAAGWLAAASGWSYPSGHTTQVTALCGALLLVVSRGAPREVRTVASVVAVTIVVLVGASRVYLGVHWLTDVLGGLTLSTAIVCGLAALTVAPSAASSDGPDASGGAHPPSVLGTRTDDRLEATRVTQT
jgi:membrane protein DedA with SNARE-associated domain/membrane-associated phospholipid phosphatase